MNPFIEGQKAFVAGRRLNANPWRGYDEASQQLQWETGWRLARQIKQFADVDAWTRENIAALKSAFRGYQKATGEKPAFADFCTGMYQQSRTKEFRETFPEFTRARKTK